MKPSARDAALICLVLVAATHLTCGKPVTMVSAEIAAVSGTYVSHNCYAGVRVVLDSSGVFERKQWSDDLNAHHPGDMLYRGERGRFYVSNDTLRLDFEAVLIDSTALRAYEGFAWIVSPEAWAQQHLVASRRENSVYLFRRLGAKRVVVPQRWQDAYHVCKEKLGARFDLHPCNSAYPIECLFSTLVQEQE